MNSIFIFKYIFGLKNLLRGEVAEKGFTLVPSRYIEFVNRDENIDFNTKMKTLQSELRELLVPRW